jgi:hypothetical protein
MPLIHSKIKNYYKYGKEGTKYHYKKDSERSRKIAMCKAKKQGQAIEISKHK